MWRTLGSRCSLGPVCVALILGAGCAEDLSCPESMVLVEGFGQLACIDRFEASRGENDEAVSVAGAYPWTGVNWIEARDACEAAGKRLCTDTEWAKGCEGSRSGSVEWPKWPYGDTYERGRCNDIADGSGVRRTRAHFRCEGGYPGLFDMSGNVAEWVDRCRDEACFIQGGSFIDDDEVTLSCNVNYGADPESAAADLGFRCCLDP